MKELNEKIFDLMLEEASKLYVENLVAEYPSPEELEGKYTFSPKFEAWIEGIIKSERRRLKRKAFKRTLNIVLNIGQKAATIMCCAFALSLLLAFTVPPIRVAILNFVTETNEDYIEMDLKTKEETNGIIGNIDIDMPKDFEIIDIDKTDALLSITYQNNEGATIFLERYIGTAGTIIDSENSGFKKIAIGEEDGYILLKNDKTTVICHDEDYGYTIISSDISHEELIEIAEDIID